MKKIIPIFSIFIIGIFNSQQKNSSLEYYPLENTFLWKIEGKNLSQPSYLFGTMHLICKDHFNISPSVIAAMDETKQLVMELDMDDPDFVTDTQKALMTDQKLTENLSVEDLEIVKNFIKEKTGGTIDVYDKVSPFLIYSLSFTNILNCETTSADIEMMKLNGDKEVKGLETIEYQVSVMKNAINYKTLAQLIKDANPDDLIIQEAFYTDNNMAKMQEYIINNAKEEPDLYYNLLQVRNENWVKKMPKLMENMPTFFAVGAGHLMGNIGLIKLLRDQGYTVTPVE